MDYKETLNLPSTSFPMKANLTQREPELLKQWEQTGLYERILEKNRARPVYTLHDGPPYANGNIHIGHALNKILKDIIVKYKSMKGFYARFVPGWDCHGLPIELQVDKKLGSKKQQLSLVEFRERCRKYAGRFVQIQREEFKRLGILGAWDAPYLTMDYRYEGTIIRELGRFVENKGIYKGKKPIHWCASCRTALAEAEVEYADDTSPSIYVGFPLETGVAEKIPALSGKPVAVVIWTTTPWTLPANLAITLHPEFTYAAVESAGEVLIIAAELVEQCMELFGREHYSVIATFKGAELEGLKARHPFEARDALIIAGDHVTLEQGTGCVHTAPGHGEDDYKIGVRYDLPIFTPVDDRGCFTEEAGPFAGQFVFKANSGINDLLREKGHLLFEGTVEHAYPHCWRCKKPIIFRATEQWFISMSSNDLRSRTLETIRDKVEWIPRWGMNRIYAMVENRPDWCISRQRSWGVPIAIFQCAECGTHLMDAEAIYHVADLVDAEGADVWFEKEAAELMPQDAHCARCGGRRFTKENDILDVWFDSGVSHTAVISETEGLAYPADLYLEGSDQHRGWFHSALLTALGTGKGAPFKSVLTHGFVVDGAGKKMSKSIGNVIAPGNVINQNGAEILRLWVSAEDYRDDLKISNEILKRTVEAYRKIRNTARFLLGNLSDFDPASCCVRREEMLEIDRWVLHKLQELVGRIDEAYEKFSFHRVYHAIYHFCTVELSARYLDIIKDRLYVSMAESLERRSAQTVLYELVTALTRLMAPVLSFTADEIWRAIPKGTAEQSVHLADFPTVNTAYLDEELAKRWEKLFHLRGEVSRVLEQARRGKVIGLSLDAAVDLYLPQDWLDFLQLYREKLPEIFIVSSVDLFPETDHPDTASPAEEIEGAWIAFRPAAGEKCERCWNYRTTVGEEPRHPSLCSRCADIILQVADSPVPNPRNP
jgi:isoleucyl-tRNA synthetase